MGLFNNIVSQAVKATVPGMQQVASAVPAQTSNPYNLYQAPGYTPGYITGAADNPATSRSGGLVGQAMNSIVPAVAPGLNSLASMTTDFYNQNQANPYGLYQAPGYVQGQITQGATPFMAPSVNASGERSTALNPERPATQPVDRSPDYYTQRAAAVAQQQQQQLRASGAAPTWGTGKNADIYNQYVSAINSGARPGQDPYDEQSFRNFAKAVTGSGALPSERATYAARTAPVTVAPQTIINANQGLHEIWMQQTRPANPLDVNSFAKWAAQNGYSTLAGESPAEQFAAFKEAKAKGTTPVAPTPVQSAPVQSAPVQSAPVQSAPVQQAQQSVAPAAAPVAPAVQPTSAPVQQTPAPAPAQTVTLENWRDSIDGPATGQPIVTPTFASTGAVRIPTATVTPTTAGYTAPRTTAPTGPSRPGYTAPSGRVYANWVPKRKVT